jgi:hypothetical protein
MLDIVAEALRRAIRSTPGASPHATHRDAGILGHTIGRIAACVAISQTQEVAAGPVVREVEADAAAVHGVGNADGVVAAGTESSRPSPGWWIPSGRAGNCR